MDNSYFVIDHWHLLRIAFGAALIVLFVVFCAIAAWMRSPRRRRAHVLPHRVVRSVREVEHA